MKEQYIRINTRGTKHYYSNKQMTVLHREDGPAVERTDGSKSWYINGICHREDGPAIEWSGGSKAWWVNGKLHREDGPAVEWTVGNKEWWVNGKRHREDGPAIESLDYKEWWVDGAKLTEDEFNDRNNVELTFDEIAEKFGVSVDRLMIKK